MLMLTVLDGIAEFEGEIMQERQREGIAKAKADSKYKGAQAHRQGQGSDGRLIKAEGYRGH